jgi:hypothetical protein
LEAFSTVSTHSGHLNYRETAMLNRGLLGASQTSCRDACVRKGRFQALSNTVRNLLLLMMTASDGSC